MTIGTEQELDQIIDERLTKSDVQKILSDIVLEIKTGFNFTEEIEEDLDNLVEDSVINHIRSMIL